MDLCKILNREPFSTISFDYEGESICAKVFPFKKSELLELLEMEEDSTALIEDTFFQRNGYFWICYNHEFGWFALHTID